MKAIFQTYVPSLVRYEGREIQTAILSTFAQNTCDSGYFQDFISRQISCQITYSIEQYLNLLSTLRRIDPKVRNMFFAELRQQLQSHDTVELSFLSAVHLAQKK